MKVLFDQCVPDSLARAFVQLEVAMARSHGWDQFKNGVLLRAAQQDGYSALITIDQGFEHQQNLTDMTIGVVLLKVHPATAERLSALVPQVEERVLLGIAGQLVVLSLDREP